MGILGKSAQEYIYELRKELAKCEGDIKFLKKNSLLYNGDNRDVDTLINRLEVRRRKLFSKVVLYMYRAEKGEEHSG